MRDLSTVERHRLADEWANGVELYDVPAIGCLIRCARRVPALRTALICGSDTLTYGQLLDLAETRGSTGLPHDSAGFAGDDRADSAALHGLARLLSEIVAAAEPLPAPRPVVCGGSHPGACGRSGECALARHDLAEPTVPGLALTLSALAAAADDRRGVVADTRSCRVDRAVGSADVRLLAARWDSADAAVEMLAALADGATLVLTTEAQRTDAAALAELIAATAATHVLAEVEALTGFADLPAPVLPTVRRWDITGTACPAILPGLLRALAPESVAGFAYTAPEYAGVAARGPLDGSGRVRPIPGARLLVLDAELCLVAPGDTGDVYLGGAALVAEPAESTADFLSDPYATGRLVKTGERGHWTADGWLVFEAAVPAAATATEIDYAAA